jgi:hypothetical protein
MHQNKVKPGIAIMAFPLPIEVARVGGGSKLLNLLTFSCIFWPTAHCKVYDFGN